MHRTVLPLFLILAACGLSLLAQTPSTTAAPQQVYADMNQLMRGVLFPAANVVFASQLENAGEVKIPPGVDPNMSTDPLTTTFGGWTAIENAALALAESSNLLLIPDRKCSNGVVAPTKDPAWLAFVEELRGASMKAYDAAKAKGDQEKMLAISDVVSKSCSGCHRRFRDRRGPGIRCT
jgi:hypothetical protein